MGFLQQGEPLWKVIEEIADDEGLWLYDLERRSDRSLRVIVDRKVDSQRVEPINSDAALPSTGATSGDCSRLCRRLMLFFAVDGEDYGIAREPEIEVSSPGINRELKRPDHFKAALEKRVKIVQLTDEAGSDTALQICNPIVGQLSEVSDKHVVIIEEQSGNAYTIAFSRIKKARVDYKF